MTTPPPALTVDESAALASASQRRTVLLSMPVSVDFATARINMPGGVSWPRLDFTVDGASAEWANAKVGYTVWIGSTLGGKERGVYWLRKTVTSTQLKIGEIGEPDAGSETLEDRPNGVLDNDYVSLKANYNLHAARSKIVYSYGSDSGIFYKYSDTAYTDQNTKPDCYFQGDDHKVYKLAEGASTVAVTLALTGVPHRGTQTVSSKLWTAPAAATGVSGTATTTLSATLPQGWHTFYYDVTLSDGTVTRAIRYVVVYADTGTLTGVAVSTDMNDTRDRTSRRVTATLLEQARASIDSESMVIVVDEATFGAGTVPTLTTQFVGWINTDSVSIDFGRIGSTVEIMSVGGIMGSLGADSQRLQYAASVTDFQKVPADLLTLNYFMWYLLRWGVVNWNALFCYYPANSALPQSANPLDVPKGTYLSQIQAVAKRLKYANAGFDSSGALHFVPHESLKNVADRAAVVRDSLTTDLISGVTATYNDRPPNRRVIAGAFIYDGTTMQAVRSEAPSVVTGQAGGEEELSGVITTTQLDLDKFAGLYYQMINQRITALTFKIPGNRDIYEPAHMQLVQYAVEAGKSPTGLALAGYGIVKSVAKRRGENGESYIDLTVEPLTSGAKGKPFPYPPPVDQVYGGPSVDPNFDLNVLIPTVSSGYGPQNDFSPDTAPVDQIKDIILVKDSGATQFRVIRIDAVAPFAATDISPSTAQRSALGRAVCLVRDPSTMRGYRLLCENGIGTIKDAGSGSAWVISHGGTSYSHEFDPVTVGAAASGNGVNTGVALTVGQTVHIASSGTWKISGTAPYNVDLTPAGQLNLVSPGVVTIAPGLNDGALLYRIGTSGAWALAGPNVTFSVVTAGTLYLISNDGAADYADNTGSLSSVITVGDYGNDPYATSWTHTWDLKLPFTDWSISVGTWVEGVGVEHVDHVAGPTGHEPVRGVVVYATENLPVCTVSWISDYLEGYAPGGCSNHNYTIYRLYPPTPDTATTYCITTDTDLASTPAQVANQAIFEIESDIFGSFSTDYSHFFGHVYLHTIVATGSGAVDPFEDIAPGVNVCDIAVSRGGNVYWLSHAVVSGADNLYINYTRNNFATVAQTLVGLYDSALTYKIEIGLNPANIWVSAGTPGTDAAIYYSADGAVSFTAGASLNTRGGSFRVPRALPSGGPNKSALNILYVKGISTNLQGQRDGGSAVTIAAGSSDYPITSHSLSSFPLDSSYGLIGLKSRDVYYTDDGGDSWTFIGTAPGSGNLYSLEVWPANKNYITVGGDGCLAYSIDRGDTFTNLWSDFNTWATAEYGAGVADIILNAIPALWAAYSRLLP